MIASVRMVNFKNFADEMLKLGPFTFIVGANASGKSNIRDALRFLHGIGRGYTLAEILEGKYGPGAEGVGRYSGCAQRGCSFRTIFTIESCRLLYPDGTGMGYGEDLLLH